MNPVGVVLVFIRVEEICSVKVGALVLVPDVVTPFVIRRLVTVTSGVVYEIVLVGGEASVREEFFEPCLKVCVASVYLISQRSMETSWSLDVVS